MTSEPDTIIWALSPNGKYAHAYAGIKALESGVPLCGRQCTPTMVLDHFDLENEIIGKVACPDCLARLQFAKYLRPIGELIQERKTGGNRKP